MHRDRRHSAPRQPHRGPDEGRQAPHPCLARYRRALRRRLRFRVLRYSPCQRPRAACRVIRTEEKDMKAFLPLVLFPLIAFAEPATVIRATELKTEPASDAATVAQLAEKTQVDSLERKGGW